MAPRRMNMRGLDNPVALAALARDYAESSGSFNATIRPGLKARIENLVDTHKSAQLFQGPNGALVIPVTSDFFTKGQKHGFAALEPVYAKLMQAPAMRENAFFLIGVEDTETATLAAFNERFFNLNDPEECGRLARKLYGQGDLYDPNYADAYLERVTRYVLYTPPPVGGRPLEKDGLMQTSMKPVTFKNQRSGQDMTFSLHFISRAVPSYHGNLWSPEKLGRLVSAKGLMLACHDQDRMPHMGANELFLMVRADSRISAISYDHGRYVDARSPRVPPQPNLPAPPKELPAPAAAKVRKPSSPGGDRQMKLL